MVLSKNKITEKGAKAICAEVLKLDKLKYFDIDFRLNNINDGEVKITSDLI